MKSERTAKVQEILTESGLDFKIEKAPMVALNAAGEQVKSPYFGLIHGGTGEVINTVKEGYTVSQNEEIVELVLRGMERFGSKLSVHRAGSINGGRKVYLQLAIEGMGKVAHDVLKRFVTIIDSNDGSTGLSVGVGDLTLSCQNQFAQFYRAGEAKFRHTATLEQKLQSIPFLIENALSRSLKMIETYNMFASTQVSRDLANALVNHLVGIDRSMSDSDLKDASTRKVNIMNELYDHIGKETADKGLNVWGLHSGVTSYTTHAKSAPKRDNGKIESIWTGSAYNMNQKSLKFAMIESGLAV